MSIPAASYRVFMEISPSEEPPLHTFTPNNTALTPEEIEKAPKYVM